MAKPRRKKPEIKQESQEMSRSQIVLSYDGPSLRNGSIDLNVIVPALAAMSQLLHAANKNINQGKAELKITVSGFRAGSFPVDLEIVQGWFSPLLTLFVGVGITDIDRVLQIIGFVKDSKTSLFDFLEWLKGGKVTKVTTQKDGSVQVESGDKAIVISQTIYNLYQDTEIRRSVSEIIEPITKAGIDRFDVKKNNQTLRSVNKDDVNSYLFRQSGSEEIEIEERRTRLLISTVSFDPTLKWRFKEKENRFYAAIEDEEFLKKVSSREQPFYAGDFLDVQLRVETLWTHKDKREKHVITKVFEYIESPRQIEMPV